MIPVNQLAVLRRQGSRPRFSWSDRVLIATLAKLVPRERWAAFLVTPETIELIVGLAHENPRRGYLRIVDECKNSA